MMSVISVNAPVTKFLNASNMSALILVIWDIVNRVGSSFRREYVVSVEDNICLDRSFAVQPFDRVEALVLVHG
jgi:hypothetical protein